MWVTSFLFQPPHLQMQKFVNDEGCPESNVPFFFSVNIPESWKLYTTESDALSVPCLDLFMHTSSQQTGGNLRVLDWGCWVDGVTLSNQIWWWLSLHTCVQLCIVKLREFWPILVRLNSLEMLSSSMFWCMGWSWSSPLSAPHTQELLLWFQKTSNHDTACWWELLVTPPPSNWVWGHSMDGLFVSGQNQGFTYCNNQG